MRLNKFISETGVCSRREADKWIEAGRVTCNGQPAVLGTQVSPGDDVRIASNVGEVHGAALSYRFTGKLDGDSMSGSLDMGEYLNAKWTAKRHTFGRGAVA